MIEVYSDGAYNAVLKKGGWGVVIVEDGAKQVFSGSEQNTTGNRMEITGALQGISRTPQGAEVVGAIKTPSLLWSSRSFSDIIRVLFFSHLTCLANSSASTP